MRLLLIIGPPAVGKMTVGREIAARSDFRLFHNHHTIEPLVEIFGYGTVPFNVLNSEFRRRVVEEAARNDVDLIFTFVWNLDDPADTTYVEQLVAPFDGAGGEIWVLELAADLETRLVRNRGESRLAAKPTKRDVEWSDANLRRMEAFHLNTDPTGSNPSPADGFLSRHRLLRLDTPSRTAAQVAEIALDWLNQAEDTGRPADIDDGTIGSLKSRTQQVVVCDTPELIIATMIELCRLRIAGWSFRFVRLLSRLSAVVLIDAEPIAVRVTEERPSRLPGVDVGWVDGAARLADRCDRIVKIINHDVDLEAALGRRLTVGYEPAGDFANGVVERQAVVAM